MYYIFQLRKRRKDTNNEKDITRRISNIKKYSPKRWVVERTNSWHNRFRKLFTRYEKKSENYLGLGTVLLLYYYL